MQLYEQRVKQVEARKRVLRRRVWRQANPKDWSSPLLVRGTKVVWSYWIGLQASLDRTWIGIASGLKLFLGKECFEESGKNAPERYFWGEGSEGADRLGPILELVLS